MKLSIFALALLITTIAAAPIDQPNPQETSEQDDSLKLLGEEEEERGRQVSSEDVSPIVESLLQSMEAGISPSMGPFFPFITNAITPTLTNIISSLSSSALNGISTAAGVNQETSDSTDETTDETTEDEEKDNPDTGCSECNSAQTFMLNIPNRGSYVITLNQDSDEDREQPLQNSPNAEVSSSNAANFNLFNTLTGLNGLSGLSGSNALSEQNLLSGINALTAINSKLAQALAALTQQAPLKKSTKKASLFPKTKRLSKNNLNNLPRN